MKVQVWHPGDPSVGMWDSKATIDINIYAFENEQHRLNTREALKEAFEEIFDGYCEVWFEDECQDCGGRNGIHTCGCPSEPIQGEDDGDD
jgi:hypothetical protein